MDTPPICDYEGSDYQKFFWEEGGRAYEDAVEAVAIKRLMPSHGELLLELGAGAGRNSHRYQGFDQIVLLDYSRSQLEQAQERLGASEHYRYVAADIYHLPFTSGLFNAATMIRTLHHLVDARRALDSIRQVLQTGSIFVLEFANKKNLKAILRYMLRRQSWNPFSPEPIEFAALNFNFHPATVHAWLQLSGFALERQLTVSHFRITPLKRYLPLGLLVRMDSLLQLTGNWCQLTPSVFMRSQAVGKTIPADEGTFFRCPACGHTPLPDTPPRLVCPACGEIYPADGGIYDFRPKIDR